jgi:hypothetical protein
MRAWNWLRDSFAGLPTVVWAVSYWPFIAAAVLFIPVTFMPVWLDLSPLVYLLSLPLGIAAGMIGYAAAYLYLEE